MLLLLLLLQTVPGPPGDEPAPVVRQCSRGGEDIVVCAHGGQPDRLPRLREQPRGTPTSARIAPNAVVSTEAVGIVRAYIPDNRILAHLKLEF